MFSNKFASFIRLIFSFIILGSCFFIVSAICPEVKPLSIRIVSYIILIFFMLLSILFEYYAFHGLKKLKQNYPNLSIIGIIRKKRSHQSLVALIILFCAFLAYDQIPKLFGIVPNSSIIITLIVLFLFILAGHFAFEFRVYNGLYGNNEREARDIIQFIIQEGSNINFKDRGKLKKFISKEDLKVFQHKINELLPAIESMK